jgi:hypothetical protein
MGQSDVKTGLASHRPTREHCVCWFAVAVGNATFMTGSWRTATLSDDMEGFPERNRCSVRSSVYLAISALPPENTAFPLCPRIDP